MADPFPNEFFFPNANSMVKTKIIPLSILYSYIYILLFFGYWDFLMFQASISDVLLVCPAAVRAKWDSGSMDDFRWEICVTARFWPSHLFWFLTIFLYIYIWFTIPGIPGAYKCNTTVQKPLAEALGLGRGTPLGSWRCIPTRPRRHEFRQIIGRFPGKKHAPCYHPSQVGSLILLYIHIKEDTVHILEDKWIGRHPESRKEPDTSWETIENPNSKLFGEQ